MFVKPVQLFQNLRRLHLPEPVIVILMVLLTLGLGVGLGFVMMTPANFILASIVAVIFYLIIIAAAPLKGVALWLILFPFAETTVNISLGEGIPDLSPTRFTIAFLIAILLGEAATGQRRFPRLTKLDFACFLFVIGIAISAFSSFDPVGAFKAILDLTIVPVLAYYVVKNLVHDKKDLDLFFNALFIIALYSCFFIFYEWATGQVLLYQGDGATIYADSGIRIVRSLWGGPHIYSSIFAMVIPLTFYRIIKADDGLWRVIYSVLLIVFLLALVLTFKRAGWISSLVSFIVIFPFFPAFRKVFLVLLVLISVSLYVFRDQLNKMEGVEQRVSGNVETANGRTDRWQVAMDLWKEKPITGHGFRNFDKLSGMEAVENYYLHLLVSGGLIAFLPFVAITVLTISESIWWRSHL